METAHTRNTPDQFDINDCQVFINIKKFKMFKIREDYLGIILFAMAIQEL